MTSASNRKRPMNAPPPPTPASYGANSQRSSRIKPAADSISSFIHKPFFMSVKAPSGPRRPSAVWGTPIDDDALRQGLVVRPPSPDPPPPPPAPVTSSRITRHFRNSSSKSRSANSYLELEPDMERASNESGPSDWRASQGSDLTSSTRTTPSTQYSSLGQWSPDYSLDAQLAPSPVHAVFPPHRYSGQVSSRDSKVPTDYASENKMTHRRSKSASGIAARLQIESLRRSGLFGKKPEVEPLPPSPTRQVQHHRSFEKLPDAHTSEVKPPSPPSRSMYQLGQNKSTPNVAPSSRKEAPPPMPSQERPPMPQNVQRKPPPAPLVLPNHVNWSTPAPIPERHSSSARPVAPSAVRRSNAFASLQSERPSTAPDSVSAQPTATAPTAVTAGPTSLRFGPRMSPRKASISLHASNAPPPAPSSAFTPQMGRLRSDSLASTYSQASAYSVEDEDVRVALNALDQAINWETSEASSIKKDYVRRQQGDAFKPASVGNSDGAGRLRSDSLRSVAGAPRPVSVIEEETISFNPPPLPPTPQTPEFSRMRFESDAAEWGNRIDRLLHAAAYVDKSDEQKIASSPLARSGSTKRSPKRVALPSLPEIDSAESEEPSLPTVLDDYFAGAVTDESGTDDTPSTLHHFPQPPARMSPPASAVSSGLPSPRELAPWPPLKVRDSVASAPSPPRSPRPSRAAVRSPRPAPVTSLNSPPVGRPRRSPLRAQSSREELLSNPPAAAVVSPPIGLRPLVLSSPDMARNHSVMRERCVSIEGPRVVRGTVVGQRNGPSGAVRGTGTEGGAGGGWGGGRADRRGASEGTRPGGEWSALGLSHMRTSSDPDSLDNYTPPHLSSSTSSSPHSSSASSVATSYLDELNKPRHVDVANSKRGSGSRQGGRPDSVSSALSGLSQETEGIVMGFLGRKESARRERR